MINIGEYQELTVVKMRSQGAYLAEGDEGAEGSQEVLLPKAQVPEGTEAGAKIRVFIYRDSADRLIATTATPLAELHKVTRLTVKEVTKIGAFLDWGLEKDLLLPFKEMTAKLKAGDEVLTALYVDKSGRLAATMRIHPYLRLDPPYIKNAEVKGTVYQIEENFGIFVAVDDTYSGMVPRRESAGDVKVGDSVTARVTAVKADGKLDLSLRRPAYLEIEDDAAAIIEIIKRDFGGELPFDDRAEPERIREVFSLSKAAFKRAVGHLMKSGEAMLSEGHIKLL